MMPIQDGYKYNRFVDWLMVHSVFVYLSFSTIFVSVRFFSSSEFVIVWHIRCCFFYHRIIVYSQETQIENWKIARISAMLKMYLKFDFGYMLRWLGVVWRRVGNHLVVDVSEHCILFYVHDSPTFIIKIYFQRCNTAGYSTKHITNTYWDTGDR